MLDVDYAYIALGGVVGERQPGCITEYRQNPKYEHQRWRSQRRMTVLIMQV